MTTQALVQISPTAYVDPDVVVVVHHPGTVTIVVLRGDTGQLETMYVEAPLADVLAALGR